MIEINQGNSPFFKMIVADSFIILIPSKKKVKRVRGKTHARLIKVPLIGICGRGVIRIDDKDGKNVQKVSITKDSRHAGYIE